MVFQSSHEAMSPLCPFSFLSFKDAAVIHNKQLMHKARYLDQIKFTPEDII